MNEQCVVFGVGLLAASLVTGSADAALRREGTWPEADPSISLDFDALPRAEGIQRLAAAAGFSVVVTAPPSDPVSVHVHEQPASKVLALLLADGEYVATRDGDLVAIRREGATPPAPPARPEPPALPRAPLDAPGPPAPPEPPAAASEADGADRDRADRSVSFGDLRINEGETVRDVSVVGGSVDILGQVTGDVSVVGGTLRVHEGAHVFGDASVVGGALELRDGARIDGDADVVGGEIKRGKDTRIGGDVVGASAGDADGGCSEMAGGASAGDGGCGDEATESLAARAGGAIARVALIFAFGVVLSAVSPARMEKLAAEVAARPMRSFGLGLAALVVTPMLMVALCVTVIGIPVALLVALGLAVGTGAGVAAVLTMIGAALAGGRTKNAQVHLAVGCALALVAGALPWVGGFVTAAIGLTGLGAVVATRGAGLFPPRKPAAV